MPYDPAEILALPAEVAPLIAEVRAALAPGGDGGKQITRRERMRILRAMAALTLALAVDGLD